MSVPRGEGPARIPRFKSGVPSLEPGQASNATLVCDEAVSVQPGQGEFAMLEGGRQVGKGAVQLR